MTRAVGVAIGLVLLASSGGAYAVNVQDAVRNALRTHPQISSVEAAERAAAHEVTAARGGFLPSVDLTAGLGRERSNIKQLRTTGADDRYLTRRETGVTVSQMLFDGNATRSEFERRAALLDAARGRSGDTREAIAFRAVEVYLDVLRARRLVELAEANVRTHVETLGKVEERVSAGIGRSADLDQARSRLALARSILTSREGALDEATVRYRRVIGEAPSALDEPAAPEAALSGPDGVDAERVASAIERGIATAVELNPALSTAAAEVEAADAAFRGTKANMLPRLDVELRMNRDDNIAGVSGTRNTDTLMLVGSWNLFRGGTDRANEQAAAERRVAAREAAVNTRRAVEEAVAVATYAKATSEARLVHLQAHVVASQATRESYQAQFDLGRRSLLDLLDAENELFTARSNRVAGRFDDLVNGYFTEATKGTLVRSLGIDDGA